MNIFATSDYLKALKARAKSFAIPLNVIAEQTRIHPSYLSRAFLGKATLSNDQLFRVCRALKLSKSEIDYLLLLRERDETGDQTYREHVGAKIEEIKREQLKLARRLSPGSQSELAPTATVAEYYLETLNAAVHMYLCIARYRKDPKLIGIKLGISADHLQEILGRLENLGLIESSGEGIKVRRPVIHLDAESPLSRRNHINWRLEAINSLQRSKSTTGSDYSLSSCFSCSAQLLPRIKEQFKEFIAGAQRAIVADDGIENVYFINFDLYEFSDK